MKFEKQIKSIGGRVLAGAFMLTVVPAAPAADFGGKKYYINPGHGGHDSDDRPTPLPLGVPMFYESDGNLARGLALRDFLKANGAAVKMSRTTNTTADDLALSTIAANSNSYGGYFMSLHTNGANASANYIVSFFRTSSSAPTTQTVSGSKTMATAVSNWHNKSHLTNFTYTTPRALGDYSFYGYNLGVLRTNNRPGYLVETVFHDYRPDGLRLKSDIYNKYTAWQIMMAARENSGGAAGATGDIKGCIIGDLRDPSESCGYTNYASRGRDAYLAVNGATVNLYNSAGTKVASMTTDNCANGLYGFFDLDPGSYTVEVAKTGYKTQKATVTVANNAASKKLFDMTKGVDSGISVSPVSATFADVTLDGTQTASSIQITVTTTAVTSDITVTTSNPAVFPVDKKSLPAAGGQFNISFIPTAAGSHSATVTLRSGSYTTKITASGTAKNPKLTFSKGFNFGQTSGSSPAWLPAGGWGALRNMCFGDGKLYIVNPGEKTIYVVKAQTAELITKLDMTGVEGGTFGVMDVKYVDGKAVACNLAAKAAEPVKVYVWDNDYVAPRCILTTTDRQGVSRLGDTFDIDGNLTNGRFIFAYGGQDGDDSRVFTYAITDGIVSASPAVRTTTMDDGTKIKLGTSPRAVADTDAGKFWIMGQQLQPTLIQENGKAQTSLSMASVNNVVQGNDFKRFEFKGSQYALATTYAPVSGTVTQSLTNGGAALIDCTNGWSDGEYLKTYPKAGLGTTRNTNFSTSVAVAVNGDLGAEFWVLISNQGLGYFRTGTVPVYTYGDPTATTLSTDMADHDFGKVILGAGAEHRFTVSGVNLADDIKVVLDGVNADQFAVDVSSVSKSAAQGTVTVSYIPKVTGEHSANLTLSTKGADPLTFALTGQASNIDPNIKNMEEVWIHSATRNNYNPAVATWWNGKTGSLSYYTRAIALASYQICALNASTSKCEIFAMPAYSDKNHGTATAVSVEGVSGGIYPLAYIHGIPATGTGTDKLWGCNAAGASGTLKIYRWENVSAKPVLMLEDNNHGGIRVGDMMSVWGNETNGKIMFTDGTKIVVYTITDCKVGATPEVITLASSLGGSAAASSVWYNGDGTYWVATKDYMPTRVDSTGKTLESFPTSLLANKYGSAIKFFDFGGRKYAVATAYLCKNGTSIADGAVQVVDMTDGPSKAKVVGTYPEDGLGAERNTTFANSLAYEVSNDGLRTNLFVHVPYQGMAYYRYNGETTGVEDVVAVSGERMEAVADGLTVRLLGIDVERVAVYNAAGEAIRYTAEDTFGLPAPGIYIVRATDTNGTLHTAKVALR